MGRLRDADGEDENPDREGESRDSSELSPRSIRGEGSAPSSTPFSEEGSLSVSLLERILEQCTEFEDRWHTGDGPRIEDYLRHVPDSERAEYLAALVAVELELRFRSGETG